MERNKTNGDDNNIICSDDDSSASTWIPDDGDIFKAIEDVVRGLPVEDVRNIGSKKCMRWVARKLGVSVENLASKKSTIKQRWEEKKKQLQENDELPTEEEIKAAAIKLAMKRDMGNMSFKKFYRVLCDDLDVEDLTPAKSIIKTVYEKAAADADDDAENITLPSDERIVAAAKKLASSSKVDLEDINKNKFLRMLQKRMDCNLSSKKVLVYATLKRCRAKHYGDTSEPYDDTNFSMMVNVSRNDNPRSLVEKPLKSEDLALKRCKAKHYGGSTRSVLSPLGDRSMEVTEITTKPNDDTSFSMTDADLTENMGMPVAAPFMVNASRNDNPRSLVEKPRKSKDLELGQNVSEATGLTWTDDFFDSDTDGLVAVFDHDYSQLFKFFMKVFICTNTLPVTLTLVPFIIIFFRAFSINETVVCGYDYYEGYYYRDCVNIASKAADAYKNLAIILLVIWIFQTTLAFYGAFRIIRSTIYSMHVAVIKDGIRVVMDNHLESRLPILAAFHCFDPCLLVSKRDETIPFDQCTKVTVKSSGEVYNDICCCCKCCFWFCLRVPFETVALDTASSDPHFYERAMYGLKEPHKLSKLWGGMKRHLNERVGRETNETLSLMASMMMQQHMQSFGNPSV